MRAIIKTGIVALGVALAVPLAAHRAAADETAGAYVSDAAITAKVKAAILADSAAEGVRNPRHHLLTAWSGWTGPSIRRR